MQGVQRERNGGLPWGRILAAQDLDAIGRKKTEQVDAVLLYLRYRGVPSDVRREIVQFLDYLWTSGQAEHETAGLDALPDSLKLRLDLALKQQLIKRVPLFEDLPLTGVVAVVRALVSVVVIPGEVIIHEGHEGHEDHNDHIDRTRSTEDNLSGSNWRKGPYRFGT